MVDDLTPEERREQDALQRILERFVMFSQKHLDENFKNHPEASSNRNLVSESVLDMAMAAQIYSKVFEGNVYQQAKNRVSGVRDFIPEPIGRPQTAVQPKPQSKARGEEMSLLEALGTFGSQPIGSGTAGNSSAPATNPDGSLNLTQPLTPEQISAMRQNTSPPQEIGEMVSYRDEKGNLTDPQESSSESEISRVLKHNAGLLTTK